MDNRSRWNIGFGGAIIISGIYLMARGDVTGGAILVGVGVWLIAK